MNKQPIEQARDADLRLSRNALLRAAQRAREVALQTGTTLVVSRHSVVEHLQPQRGTGTSVQETEPPYGDEQ